MSCLGLNWAVTVNMCSSGISIVPDWVLNLLMCVSILVSVLSTYRFKLIESAATPTGLGLTMVKPFARTAVIVLRALFSPQIASMSASFCQDRFHMIVSTANLTSTVGLQSSIV